MPAFWISETRTISGGAIYGVISGTRLASPVFYRRAEAEQFMANLIETAERNIDCTTEPCPSHGESTPVLR